MIRTYGIRLLALLAFMASMLTVQADIDDILNFTPNAGKKDTAAFWNVVAETTASNVVTEDLVLTQKELLDDLLAKLEKKYKPEGRLELEALQIWQDLKMPSSRWEAVIYQYPVSGLEARITIGFKLFSGGSHIGSYQYPVIAHHWQDAFIARRQINAGTRLDVKDFIKQELDSFRLRDGLVPVRTILDNYEAHSTITLNKPLYKQDIVGRKLVSAGEYVQEIAKRGTLEVTMRAKSLEDGALGDIITLRNIESDKRIKGEVIDEATVKVHF